MLSFHVAVLIDYRYPLLPRDCLSKLYEIVDFSNTTKHHEISTLIVKDSSYASFKQVIKKDEKNLQK